ncbi:hypothetical protein Hdeb2414_s0194g00829171 [Helianthus debilis subsp. tardiflorus]
MSWFSNYLFGDYSDESVVPDSYEGTAISDSFEKPVSSNLRETEVVSGIRYRDNTVQLDLNTPVEDPYAQQGYSNFGYGGDYSFVQQVSKITCRCGFRSVAVGLGLKQNSYLKIREQLLKELRMHESLWRQVFDPENVGHYDALVKRIDFQGVGRAGIENYMSMPETGFLIAQRYGVIVHTFDIRGSDTIFPMLGGPNEAEEPHMVVAIVFVDNGHFIHVELEGCYPMPPPNLLWTSNRTERAAGWHTLYRDQIDTYEMLTYRAPDLNATPYVHDVS